MIDLMQARQEWREGLKWLAGHKMHRSVIAEGTRLITYMNAGSFSVTEARHIMHVTYHKFGIKEMEISQRISPCLFCGPNEDSIRGSVHDVTTLFFLYSSVSLW